MGGIEAALLIGRIQRSARGLSLHPYSIHRQDREVVHLCFDNAKANASKPTQADHEQDETFEAEEETESTAAFSPAVSRVLDEVDDALLAMAEAGLASSNPLRIERLRQAVPLVERLGLQALTTGLQNTINHPQTTFVLRNRYLSQLHRRAMPPSV